MSSFELDTDENIISDIFHFIANDDTFMANMYIAEAEKRNLNVSFYNGKIIVRRNKENTCKSQ